MSTSGLETFDTTIQATNLWLKGVMQRLDTEDRHLAYTALRAVLHALRDRIGAGKRSASRGAATDAAAGTVL